MVICYEARDGLYVNLTNRCTNACSFCLREQNSFAYGHDLWLVREPSKEEIWDEIKKQDLSKYKEIVFCGYGEPMMRFPDIVWVAKKLKEKYPLPIRINTNGQANLLFKEDVTPMLEGLIDTMSISLNASDAKKYDEICHSIFGEEAFSGLLDFAKKCKAHIPNVVLSVVDVIGAEEVEKCQKIADEIGVTLRVRAYIPEGQSEV